ncbi:MAG TPA: hypothetical protein DF427_10600 [Moraxellaceae bacterium]|nr:hypothetical protein [Moraxellaceae bacterium]
MNDKFMLPGSLTRLRHAESAAIALVIAGALMLPLERLHTSGMLLLATLIMALVAGRPFLSRSAGLYRPLAFLTAGILAASLFSSHPGKGWVVVRNLILAFATGALFFQIAVERSATMVKATQVAVLMIVMAALVAIASTPSLWSNFLNTNFNQISGFANENSWGLAIALVANTALVAGLLSRSSSRILFISIYIGLIGFLYITAMSRGAMLSSLITGMALSAFVVSRKSSWRALVAPLAVAMFLAASTLMTVAAVQLNDNFAFFDKLATYRLTVYKISWSAITEAPFWGHGARTFALNMGQETLAAMGQTLGTPHNILLEALYSLGVIGSMLWAVGIGFFWRHRPACSTATDDNRTFVRLLGYAIFMQLLFHGMVDLSIFSAYFLTLLFVSGALIMASNQPVKGISHDTAA